MRARHDSPRFVPQMSLPYGSTTSMPEPHVFGGWTAAVLEKADAALTDIEEKKGRIMAVRGGHSDIEVQVHCKPHGVVSLKAVLAATIRSEAGRALVRRSI